MYVYGGVAVREADGSRQPADTEAGLVHAFNLHTYTWSALHTKGARVRGVEAHNSSCVLQRLWQRAAACAVKAQGCVGMLPTTTWVLLCWCAAAAAAGAQRPRSTTLLAFFWHDGSLWAIPDRPAPQQQAGSSSSSSSRRGGSTAAAGGYQLFRLDVFTREWQLVPTQVWWACVCASDAPEPQLQW
jgi:hypothetical protein